MKATGFLTSEGRLPIETWTAGCLGLKRFAHHTMRTTTLTFPELILIAATRGMLGAGLALLISKRLTEEQRETAGMVLTLIGAITTVPLAMEAFGKSESK